MLLALLLSCGSTAPRPARVEDFGMRLVAERGGDPVEAWSGPELSLEGGLLLTGADVERVDLGRGGDDGRELSIHVFLTPEAGRRLEEITTSSVGRRLALIVDGRVAIAPLVRDPIAGGRLEITGESEAEVREMYARLTAEE